MSNLFFGLNIGRSALLSNQAALSVTGHNLANVQTEGYSRQRVEMTPSLPIQLQSHTFGSGVTVDAVDRISAAWVERQLNLMQGQNGYDSTLRAGLDQVQAVLGEPSSDGIGAALTEFFNSWDALSVQPGDSGLRAQVLNQAENLDDRVSLRVGQRRRVLLREVHATPTINRRRELGRLVVSACVFQSAYGHDVAPLVAVLQLAFPRE